VIGQHKTAARFTARAFAPVRAMSGGWDSGMAGPAPVFAMDGEDALLFFQNGSVRELKDRGAEVPAATFNVRISKFPILKR